MLCTKIPKSHPRQWVVHSNALYPNTTSGAEIPPTAVGGSFKSFLREDLKYPPTAVGGITRRFTGYVCRRHLNQSTHCRGWDLGLFVQSRVLQKEGRPRSAAPTVVTPAALLLQRNGAR